MSRNVTQILFISGINPGPTGTGRLLEFLWSQRGSARVPVASIFGPLGLNSWKKEFRAGNYGKGISSLWAAIRGRLQFLFLPLLLRLFYRDATLVLFHFQSIGFSRCRKILNSHRGPVYAYLVDNNFFCLRSYNHIPGEMNACLLCLHKGYGMAAIKGCPSKPFHEENPTAFLEELQSFGKSGRLKLLTQNQRQTELARKNFGADAKIDLVGDWMSDWEEAPPTLAKEPPKTFDFVFHGSADPAKGAAWAIAVARQLPSYSFLFPFSQADATEFGNLPSNAHFQPISWATGLGWHCQKARFVLVPSLWSAPVEGALVKSILWGRATVVVDVEGTFGGEISETVVLRAPAAPNAAADFLEARAKENWQAEEGLRLDWVDKYRRENIQVLDRIVKAVLD